MIGIFTAWACHFFDLVKIPSFYFASRGKTDLKDSNNYPSFYLKLLFVGVQLPQKYLSQFHSQVCGMENNKKQLQGGRKLLRNGLTLREKYLNTEFFSGPYFPVF